MTNSRQLWLGLLILVSLGTLGAYTLFGSDLNLFGNKLFLQAEFPQAKGARKGDSVMLAGTRVGRVTEVTFRPDAPDEKRILVEMRIDEPIVLREGYVIAIEDATLLGGRLVSIEPGPYGASELDLEDGKVLVGTIQPDIFEALGGVGQALSGDELSRMIENLDAIVADLRNDDVAGDLNRAVESIANTGESLERVMADVEAGSGTLGALLNSSELYDNWNSVGREANALVVEAREGEGLLGRLISDGTLAQRAEDAIAAIEAAGANLGALTDGVQDNGSVVNRLFQDAELGQRLDETVTNIRDFSGDLAQGDGTLARLIDDSTLYDTLLAASTDVRTITDQVASGQGTVGRLIMSDEIYDELATALRTANRGLEDYREAAPITTFTSLIFAGF